jgi:1,4-dihydroxy-2-naphthoate octaprenyltransferase
MRYSNNNTYPERRTMRTRQEVALAWVIVVLVALPIVILYPAVIGIGILGYALHILYTHYRRV